MQLMDYIIAQASEEQYDFLPFFHTTLSKEAETIIREGLKPRLCEVFNQNLTYLFYGRASFSHNNHIQMETSTSQRLAVSFGIRFDVLNDSHMFLAIPFDTGACKKNRYIPHIHYTTNTFNIYRFSEKNNIKMYINRFFGNNTNYIMGRGLNTNNSDVDIKALNDLILDTVNPNFDERARTIEYSTNQAFNLENYACIVMHIRDYEKKSTKHILEKYPNIKIITYITSEVVQEKTTFELVKSKVMEWLIESTRGNES
jgi:hypothetical protein